MNDSGLRAQGSRCYQRLKAIDDLSYYGAWAQALDAMKNSLMWLKWKTQGRDQRALDSMNNLGLWITWATQGHELRDLETMNNSRLW